jgi:DNA-binding FadR family transcriptional regulator
VRLADDWNVLDPDVLDWQLQAAPREELVRELFELRRILEPGVAARAAETASADDISRMASAYAAMEEAVDDREGFIGPDTDFHNAILKSIDSRMVHALGNMIGAALSISLRMTIDAPEGQRPSLPRHKAVLDAIERRDPGEASAAMALLIDDARHDALRALAREATAEKRRRNA